MTHQGLQLRGDLRQAFENYMGDMVSGPWEQIIDTVAAAVEGAELSASEAARLDLALRRTRGGTGPGTGCHYESCGVCGT